MKPTWKPNLQNTIHRDGTVSFFQVYSQTWTRCPAAAIPDRELAAMSRKERDAIERHAVRHG